MDIFCQIKEKLGDQIIKETKYFYLTHDGYPLTEGHVLIIPKKHIRCFLELPDGYKKEYGLLKKETTEFLKACYQRPVIFEHGLVGQTVPHAHLHFLPTRETILPQIKSIAKQEKTPVVPYLYYEKNSHGVYFDPRGEVEKGFLHVEFAKALKRPVNGPERVKELPNWLLRVKKQFRVWQKRSTE